jgi:hypothetical protein
VSDELREKLARGAGGAPPPDVGAVVGRARRLQRRDRMVLAAGMLAVVAVLAGTVMAALPSNDDEIPVAATDAPETTEEQAQPLGSGSWEGARTSADGRTLVVTFVGGPEYDPHDHCTVRYGAHTEETTAEVRIRIEGWSPPAREGYGCGAAGNPRRIEVPLAEPFGDRRLVEVQFDREQPVFPGHLLASPAWLPDDFGFAGERGFMPHGGTISWIRTWAPPPVPDTGSACTPSRSMLELTQGPPDVVSPYGIAGEGGSRSAHDVRGHEAVLTTDPEARLRRLAWVEGDQGFVAMSTPRCAGDEPISEEDLLRFADGLELPADGPGEGQDDRAAPPPPGPGPGAEGDPAVWEIDSGDPPTSTATSFTALVTRLGCSGGRTGEVLEPRVEIGPDTIVVTFTVEALDGPHRCPGNDSVPYRVELGEAIGERRLVDSSCQPGGPAETTSLCTDGATRWRP